jgi:arsenate reductase
VDARAKAEPDAVKNGQAVERSAADNFRSVSDPDPRLTVYEKPTCSTCRSLFTLLTERGVDFERVNYIVDPLSASQIRELLAKTGLRPRDVVRMKEPGASQLPLEDDQAVLAALEAHPELLQRPIVVRGERAVLARPPERVLELLS